MNTYVMGKAVVADGYITGSGEAPPLLDIFRESVKKTGEKPVE
jgi:hypothetical protein